MTLVDILDTITKWADREICSKIKLKIPPEDIKESNGPGYQHQFITPACFPLFVPTSEKIPPSILSPTPSLCVRIIKGEDDMVTNMGNIVVEFVFSVWSLGTHGPDILLPQENHTLRQWTGEEAEAYFERNYDGWRDIWNWIDIALRAIESHLNIDGIEIDRSTNVKFYQFEIDGVIPELYPFWYAGIQFQVKRPLMRNIIELQDLL